MSKSPKTADKADPHLDLLMVTARTVEQLTRLGHKELHADMASAIAAVEKPEGEHVPEGK